MAVSKFKVIGIITAKTFNHFGVLQVLPEPKRIIKIIKVKCLLSKWEVDHISLKDQLLTLKGLR